MRRAEEGWLFAEVERFDLRAYHAAARELGRASLPLSQRQSAAELQMFCEAMRRDAAWSAPARQMLGLAERLFDGERHFLEHGRMNYPSYINDRILSYALRAFIRRPFEQVCDRSMRVFTCLLDELILFEVCSLAGTYAWYGKNFDPAIVSRRIERLRELRAALPCHHVLPALVQEASTWLSWDSLSEDDDCALLLAHFQTLPLTQEHDEYFFQRILQLSECCFQGILVSIIVAIDQARRRAFSNGIWALDRALRFAELLAQTYQVLKTMPREHFWAFRDDTDGSSAIQSRRFQAIHAYCTGFDAHKARVVREIPEIRDIVNLHSPRFMTLRKVVEDLEDPNLRQARRFTEAVEQFDKMFYRARCIHLGIVHSYVPPEAGQGTGGTTGASYLRSHLRQRIWPPDAEHVPLDSDELASWQLGALRPLSFT